MIKYLEKMKKQFGWIVIMVVFILIIGAATQYRIRDIQGDKPGNPTLWEELRLRYLKTEVNDSLLNRFTKTQSDLRYVKVSDGFVLTDTFATRTEVIAKIDSTVLANTFFTMVIDGGSIGTPAASTAYYFGLPEGGGTSTSVPYHQFNIPYNCEIIGCVFTTKSNTTVASSETFSLYLRLNNTTDVLLVSGINCAGPSASKAYNFTNTAVNQSITANTLCEFKFTTPAWTQLPGATYITATLYFRLL